MTLPATALWIAQDGAVPIAIAAAALAVGLGWREYAHRRRRAALMRELDRRRAGEQALQAAVARLRDFSELSADWCWEQDAELRFARVEMATADRGWVAAPTWVGRRCDELPPRLIDQKAWNEFLRIAARREAFRDHPYRLRNRHGSERHVLVSGKPIFDADGRFLGYRGTGRDVTAARRAELALHAEKERAEVTLASIADAVITTDRDGRVTFLNPVAESLTGWNRDDAAGRPLSQVYRVIDEASRQRLPDSVTEVLRSSDTVLPLGPRTLLGLGGAEHPVEESAAPIRGLQGELIGAVLVFRDVSQARQLARELAYQASHDALTELVNRREFERRLQLLLGRLAHESQDNALLYLDLDQFKVVNDTCGHAAGDELLRQLALVLRPCLRGADTLARLGGDEFGVLLESCNADTARRVAESLVDAVRRFRFRWDGRDFSVGVSIGVVAFRDAGQSQSALLAAADTACYVAKDRGRNYVHVYREDDAEFARRHDEMEYALLVQRALDGGRFVLHRQRIQPLRHRAVGEHFEVLLRLAGDDGGLTPPRDFLRAAERYQLMPAVDRWVVGNALEQCAAMLERDPDGLACCAINLSGATLSDPTFTDFVRAEFDRTGVPHRLICFEITETAAIANIARAVRFIRKMKRLGCRFALDDFGSGMSSFAYLKQLPVDYLKIDGGFVRDILSNRSDLAVVEAIRQIGDVFGIETVAEFVETDAVCERLAEMGVHYAQGYAIAEPVPFGTPAAAAAG